MAETEKEKTVLETIAGIAVGAVSAEIANLLTQAGTKNFRIQAMRHANTLRSNQAARSKIAADIADLISNQNDPVGNEAGKRVLGWFTTAWKEKNTEGELTNLYLSFDSAGRKSVFKAFGSIYGPDDYEKFELASFALLKSDNLFQLMLRAAEHAQKTGGEVMTEDVKKLVNGAKAAAQKVASGIDKAAGAVLPILDWLDARL